MQCVRGAGLVLAAPASQPIVLPFHSRVQKRTIICYLHGNGKAQPAPVAMEGKVNAIKNDNYRAKNVTRLYSMAVPIFVLAAAPQIIEGYSDWQPSQAAIKSVYMVFSIMFCWGCCVFGAMKDPFYESEEYRKGGGDGTQHYVYHYEEIDEEKAREELWREELLQELDEKVGELRDVEEKEREKELV